MQVVDSLGNTHNLTITFTQSAAAASSWSYNVSVRRRSGGWGNRGERHAGESAGSQRNRQFHSKRHSRQPGGPGSRAPVAVNLNNLADGAANMTMNWNLFDPTTGNGQLTDYSQASGLASSTQDGTTASSLTSVGIQDGGQVVATYSNGKTKVEAQLAMAEVQNPTSLQNVGNNNFSIGANTSTPAIGGPQSGSRGQILGGAVESSNVDMATQFTNLIVYQSAYQASSRVISTEQTIDQDLLQLIH